MKLRNMVAPVVFGALSLVGVSAHADGTLAGTTIENTAELKYTVNTVEQKTNSKATFQVDVEIDFTLAVSQSSIRSTDLSNNNVVLASLKLKNTGNAGGTFTIDMTDLAIDQERTLFTVNQKDTYNLDAATAIGATKQTSTDVDNDDNAVVTTSSNRQITVEGLDADKSVLVEVTIPKGAFGGELDASKLSIQEFTAKATHSAVVGEANLQPVPASDSSGAPNEVGVQFVFADASDVDGSELGNNSEVVLQGIKLNLPYFPDPTGPGPIADIEKGLVKSARVLWDPVNGELAASVYPKAIPGAVVEYTVTLRNFGNDAGTMEINDLLDSDTTLCQATDNGASNGSKCINAVHDNKDAPVAEQTREQASSDTSAPSLGSPAVDAVVTTPNNNSIKAVFNTYPANQKAVIKYTVTIN